MRNIKLLILIGAIFGGLQFIWVTVAAAESESGDYSSPMGEFEQKVYQFESQAWFGIKGLSLKYKETSANSDLEKEWDGLGIRADVGVNAYRDIDDRSLFGIKLQAGYMSSETEEEEIHSNGNNFLEDELQVRGFELFLGVSWVRLLNEKFRLEHTVGVGHRELDFRREGLFFGSEPLGRLTWETSNQYASYSPQILYQATPHLSLSLQPSVAYIFYAKSHNNLSGTINGDGGYILGTAARLDYHIWESASLFLEASWEKQKITGGEAEDATLPSTFNEWPDNELTTFGLAAGLAVNF